MNFLVQYSKNLFSFFLKFFKTNKEFLITIIILIIFIHFFFFLLYYNYKFLLFFYNDIFISKIDYIIYIFKDNFIKILKTTYKYYYQMKFFLIQKYYTVFEYNYMKEVLKNDFDNNLGKSNSQKIYTYLQKAFFKYFSFLQNTEYYKKFDPKLYNLDFIYSYKRKGDCSRMISDNLLYKYLPDSKKYKLHLNKSFKAMKRNYNYVYTAKQVFVSQKALTLYNELFFRRRFFIIENTFFSNKELLNYEHDLEASRLGSMSISLEKSIMKKIAAFNFRRKDSSQPLMSFEEFDEFDTTEILTYEHAISLNKTTYHESKDKIDKLQYKTFMRRLAEDAFYDNIVKLSILERDLDNFYLTGTTEIFYLDKTKYRLINYIGLTDYFFYYLYYSFLEIPFFFEDFHININKKTDFKQIIKLFFNEFFKMNNFYVIVIFTYSLYIMLRSIVLIELDLLYSLIFLKRHLTALIIFGFILKFNLDVYDPLSFELFLLIWIPVFINYIVYEEWWWVWWTTFEKVKYHFTFNYENLLYGPMNIYICYILLPNYIQSFFLFKILILHYLIFHFNRIDFKWKYIIQKNIFYYFFLLYTLIFYNFFLVKEELNLLKSRFNFTRQRKNLNVFFLNFNIYSRFFLSNINNLLSCSLLFFLKKYIQFFIYYVYMFFFLFVILLMFFKIIYNINIIFNIYLLKNELDIMSLIKNNSNYYLFFKNNINLSLFKEYQITQRNNYYKYNIIYDYKNTNGFPNHLHYKFHYPGLLFYRTSRQFNSNLYWLYFQGGNNFIGETHFKATILNSFYKKNLSYFYKYFLLDSKTTNWNGSQKMKFAKLSKKTVNSIKYRRFTRMLDEVEFQIYRNSPHFNFINIKDIKFMTLITKNFYKTTSFYTNNRTYYFSLYTFKYYHENYPLAMDDLPLRLFTRKMRLYTRAWGKYHMNGTFLPMYSHCLLKFFYEGGNATGKDVLNSMNDEFNSNVLFHSVLEKNNINQILLYNKYIPSRLDYMKFHSLYYEKIHIHFAKELDQTISEIGMVKKEVVKDNSISIFTLIFNFSEYIRIINEREALAFANSEKISAPWIHQPMKQKPQPYI